MLQIRSEPVDQDAFITTYQLNIRTAIRFVPFESNKLECSYATSWLIFFFKSSYSVLSIKQTVSQAPQPSEDCTRASYLSTTSICSVVHKNNGTDS